MQKLYIKDFPMKSTYATNIQQIQLFSRLQAAITVCEKPELINTDQGVNLSATSLLH